MLRGGRGEGKLCSEKGELCLEAVGMEKLEVGQ